MSETPDRATPFFDRALIALLMLCALIGGVYALPGSDSVRDAWVAHAMLAQGEWPWRGPVLAQTLHFGPLWYYLLWPAAMLGRSTWAIAAFVALLGALKFPLAYALGRAVHGRRLALAFALALFLPGWTRFQVLLPTHTLLVEAAALAYALMLLRAVREPSGARMVALGGLFGLALHAHPTLVVLAPLTVLAIVVTRRWTLLRPWPLCGAALLALLPFLPWLIGSALSGARDAAQVQVYVASQIGLHGLLRVPALLWALLWSGPAAAHATFFEGAWHALALAGSALAVLLAFAGALRAARAPDAALRRWGVTGLIALLACLATVALLRPITPWYYTYLPAAALAFLLALGFAALPRAAWRIAAALMLALGLASTLAGVRAARSGEMQAVAAMADVARNDLTRAPPSPVLPVREAARLAQRLCTAPALAADDTAFHAQRGSTLPVRGQPVEPQPRGLASSALPTAGTSLTPTVRGEPVEPQQRGLSSGELSASSIPPHRSRPRWVLHASLAGLIDASGAIDLRLGCAAPPALLLGGAPDIPLAQHRIGLPMRLWRALQRRPAQRVAGLGIDTPRAVLGESESLTVADPARYPMRPADAPPSLVVERRFRAPADAALLVASPILHVSGLEDVEVTRDATPLPPLAATHGAWLFHAPGEAHEVEWVVRARRGASSRMDVVQL